MSYEVIVATTAKVLHDPIYDSIDFIWHGGEPTLLGRKFFEKAIYAQARLRRPNQAISNSLQTNATLLDDDWARFFQKNRFGISISLDGPAFIQDTQRHYRSGRPSSGDVRRGIECLKRNGIPVSALAVVDRETLKLGPDFIFDFLIDQGIKSFGLLAAKPVNLPSAHPGTPTGHYVTPAEMAQFLSRLFDRWTAYGDPTIHIREFDSILKRLIGKRASTCVLAGNCFGSYFLVEPDGGVAHCDLFIGDPAYTFGNILSDSFADFRSSPRMKALQSENQAATKAMSSCPNFAICNGWCPHERYLAFRHDPEYSPTCCGLGQLIDHIRGRIEPDGQTSRPRRDLQPL